MDFNSFIRQRYQFFRSTDPLFYSLFFISVQSSPSIIDRNTLQELLRDNLIKVSVSNITFNLQTVPSFNDYEIILVNPFTPSSGELNLELVETQNYTVTKFFKKIISSYHEGWNLTRHLQQPLNLVLNLVKHTTQYGLGIYSQIIFYDCTLTNVQSNTSLSYENHDLLTVAITFTFKNFKVLK